MKPHRSTSLLTATAALSAALFSIAPAFAQESTPPPQPPAEHPPEAAAKAAALEAENGEARARNAGVLSLYFENDYFGGTVTGKTGNDRISYCTCRSGRKT